MKLLLTFIEKIVTLLKGKTNMLTKITNSIYKLGFKHEVRGSLVFKANREITFEMLNNTRDSSYPTAVDPTDFKVIDEDNFIYSVVYDSKNWTNIFANGSAWLVEIISWNPYRNPIMDGSFSGCQLLESVPSMKNMVIESANNTFNNCWALADDIEIKKINSDTTATFLGCMTLVNCTIGSINGNVSGLFQSSTGIQNFKVGDINGDFNSSFSGCTSLKTVEVGNVNGTLGGTFSGCTSLETAKVGNVSGLGGTFSGCSSLKKATVGNIESMGGVFGGCSSLEEVTMGDVESSLGGSFSSCPLKKLVIGKVNGGLGGAFSGSGDRTNGMELIIDRVGGSNGMAGAQLQGSYVKSVKINSIESGNFYNALAGCSLLTKVEIGEVEDSNLDFGSTCSGSYHLKEFIIHKINASSIDLTSTFSGVSALEHIPSFILNNYAAITKVPSLFDGCFNINGGALQLYNRLIEVGNVEHNESTFSACGRDTEIGAIELAQIPASWGGLLDSDDNAVSIKATQANIADSDLEKNVIDSVEQVKESSSSEESSDKSQIDESSTDEQSEN